MHSVVPSCFISIPPFCVHNSWGWTSGLTASTLIFPITLIMLGQGSDVIRLQDVGSTYTASGLSGFGKNVVGPIFQIVSVEPPYVMNWIGTCPERFGDKASSADQ